MCRQFVAGDGKILSQCHAANPFHLLRLLTGLTSSYTGPVNRPADEAVFRIVSSRKELTMTKFGFLSVAGFAASALALASPALAHEGYPYAHAHYGAPHFAYPGHRVVFVRPPVFAPRPIVVYGPPPAYYYAPAPVYYTAPAPVYPAPTAAATLGGAIAGAAIGGVVGHGRPGAIVAGSVLGAFVGNGLAR
jgi:hypothetical protein